MKKTSPTLQDVAKYAGVSTATVSRCLNDPQIVRSEVRDKIHSAIEQLRYVPHGAARALASRKTYTIGAIVPTLDNAIFAEAIQYLQRGLRRGDYTLLIASSGYSLDEELREVKNLIGRGIDGLVLIGELHHPEVFSAIEEQQIPIINLWTYNPDSVYSCVGFDHIKAGRKLAMHLLEQGHREFGAISALLENNDRAIARLKGFVDCIEENGCNFSEDRVMECRYTGEQGRLAMRSLIQRHSQITAVICGNDILALGGLCAARELGLVVPTDLSITGFDNMEIIPSLLPKLTTVNSPSRRMGLHAAKYLLRRLRQDTRQIERIELHAELIVRETTAPPTNSC
jgi:LacI family transcriptional regulator